MFKRPQGPAFTLSRFRAMELQDSMRRGSLHPARAAALRGGSLLSFPVLAHPSLSLPCKPEVLLYCSYFRDPVTPAASRASW